MTLQSEPAAHRPIGVELALGFFGQFARMASGRYLIMLFLLLGGAWVSSDVYSHQVIHDMPVAVIDFDQTHVSRTIRSFIDATREVKVVPPPQPVSIESGQEALVRGDLAGIVVIPSDLTTNLKRGRKATVIVSLDESNILVAKNVYKALAKAKKVALEANGLHYVSASLPKQQRETRVVKDLTPDQIAAELVEWIGAE